MLPFQEIAELIDFVERHVGGRVCIYDYAGQLAQHVPPKNTVHNHPYCRYVIETTGRCKTFDYFTDVPNHLQQQPEGFFKLCHGGVLEFVAPIRLNGRLLGTLLVGQFRVAKSASTQASLRASRMEAATGWGKKLFASLPTLDATRRRDVRQLGLAAAARIAEIAGPRSELAETARDRKWVIEQLVERRFRMQLTLAEVARELNLSASRARRVVQSEFGMPLSALLTARRLEYAKELLAISEASIAEIASACGFNEPTYFHRVFRQQVGVTPDEYRQACR